MGSTNAFMKRIDRKLLEEERAREREESLAMRKKTDKIMEEVNKIVAESDILFATMQARIARLKEEKAQKVATTSSLGMMSDSSSRNRSPSTSSGSSTGSGSTPPSPDRKAPSQSNTR